MALREIAINTHMTSSKPAKLVDSIGVDALFSRFVAEWHKQPVFALHPLPCGLEVSWGVARSFALPLSAPPALPPFAPPAARGWASLPASALLRVLAFSAPPPPLHGAFAPSVPAPAPPFSRVCRAWRRAHAERSLRAAAAGARARWGALRAALAAPAAQVACCGAQAVARALLGRGPWWGGGAPALCPSELLRGARWQDPGVAQWLLEPDGEPASRGLAQLARGLVLENEVEAARAAVEEAAAWGGCGGGGGAGAGAAPGSSPPPPPLSYGPGASTGAEAAALLAAAASGPAPGTAAALALAAMALLAAPLKRAALDSAFSRVAMPGVLCAAALEAGGVAVCPEALAAAEHGAAARCAALAAEAAATLAARSGGSGGGGTLVALSSAAAHFRFDNGALLGSALYDGCCAAAAVSALQREAWACAGGRGPCAAPPNGSAPAAGGGARWPDAARWALLRARAVCDDALTALMEADAAAAALPAAPPGGAGAGARARASLRAAADLARRAQLWREAAAHGRGAAALRGALQRRGARGDGGGAPPRAYASVGVASATGRWVFSDPPLQCLPRCAPAGCAPLRAALAAPPGALLLAADYRAAELRVLAHFCGDAALLRALEGGGDVFDGVARGLLDLPSAAAVGAADRRAAKALAYGILYGMGDSALGRALSVPPAAAAARRADFHARFPGVRAFTAALAERGAAAGEVRTLAGRRRLVGGGGDGGDRSARQAVNSVMQGSVADLTAVACARAVGALAGCGARLALVVHDELVFEVPVPRLGEVAAAVRRAMLAAGEELGMRAPLAVRLTAGANYGALEELRL